jgi:GntR family transcriptional regulator of arabinose operon
LVNALAQGLGKRSEHVLRTLRAEIAGGAYAVGEKLPTESELCERFAVSRSTIRRATARLAEEGWLTVRRRAGMTVRRSGPARPAAGRQVVALMTTIREAAVLAIQREACQRGLALQTFFQDQQQWDPETERLFLEGVRRQRPRGLLAFLSPRAPRNDNLVRSIREAGVRVIHTEHHDTALPAEEFLMPDYRLAGYQAATSMLLGAYEDCRFAGMRIDGPYAQLQVRGFTEALAVNGRPAGEEVFFEYPRFGQQPQAAERVRAFVRSLQTPAAVLCRSDDIATTLLRILQEEGVRVPEEVGLITVGPLVGKELVAGIDCLCFDRRALLKRAAEAVFDEDPEPLRRLAPPTWRRAGTLRSPAAGDGPAPGAPAPQ